MKQWINRAICTFFAATLIIILDFTGTYAYSMEVMDPKIATTVIIENEESIYMEATCTINAHVLTYDDDIAINVDTYGAVNGYITLSYDNSFTTKVKVLIRKDGKQYLYAVNSGTANFPLQMGDGIYSIIIYKSPDGGKYKRLTEITMKVDGLKDEVVYTNPIQMADYEKYSDVMDGINKLTATAKTDEEKVKIIYNYITSHFKYSNEKAKIVQYSAGYIPDLREFAGSGEGICYDYASLFTAALRSNGIPAKLVMGGRAGVNYYHAWSEVLLGGEWVIIDTTFDASILQAGKKTDMIKANDLYSKTKEY